MKLRAEHFSDATLITVDENRIDAAGAIAFKDSICALTVDAKQRVVVDLGKVDFVDSSGLGAIVGAMKLLAPNRKMELAALTTNVEKVFHLTRMDSVFAIHISPADAFSDGFGIDQQA